MKNAFKFGFLATCIAVSVAACSGNSGGQHSDSLKADTSVMSDSTNKTMPAAGSNGSAISSDTGLDKSGSGGADTTKTP
ncbi:hypothetical protein A0256_16415 [Mucilaginibacter sp. PAMC 26640]|nr:hypothetical protein A0256_16415 [Mucilaginibacter sp. PAMC 26640]